MHVHTFALDGQAFLKKGTKISQVFLAGMKLINRASSVGRERWGSRDPQQIAFVLKTGQARDVCVSMMYGGFFRCLGPECPG